MSPLLYSLAVTAAMIVVKMVAKLVCRHLLSGEVRREPGFVAVFWVGILSVWILTAPWSPVESARSLVEPVLMIALGLLGVKQGERLRRLAQIVVVNVRPLLTMQPKDHFGLRSS